MSTGVGENLKKAVALSSALFGIGITLVTTDAMRPLAENTVRSNCGIYSDCQDLGARTEKQLDEYRGMVGIGFIGIVAAAALGGYVMDRREDQSQLGFPTS